MTTPDEVLRAMAEAIDPHNCNWANGLPGPLKAQAFRQAERALAAAEQAGWALVPVEPTEEMVEKGSSYFSYHPLLVSSWARKTWTAMIAAAPKVGEP